MRWYWIDRFLEFQSGSHAVTIKCVSLVEEEFEDYVPGHPLMPGSLNIEGFAQTGGLLVGEHGGFTKRVVLAKVSKAIFHEYAKPGDVLRYTCTLGEFNDNGANVNCVSHIISPDPEERLHCEAELMFGHVPPQPGIPDEMFEPQEFLSMIRIFGMYDVLVDAEGNRKPPPQHLLDAEREKLAEYAM